MGEHFFSLCSFSRTHYYNVDESLKQFDVLSDTIPGLVTLSCELEIYTNPRLVTLSCELEIYTNPRLVTLSCELEILL